MNYREGMGRAPADGEGVRRARRRSSRSAWVAVGALAAAIALGPPSVGGGPDGQRTLVLRYEGEEVRILRDRYGVPHVFAPSARAAYFGNGYAIAQDRLAQMDRYRRQARGELAELEGVQALVSDREARRTGYTEVEREAQLAELSEAARTALVAYAEGVNACLRDYERQGYPDYLATLPIKPRPWRPTDSLAIAQMMARRFGGSSSLELQLSQIRAALQTFLGPQVDAILDDLTWRNDPAAPTTLSPADSPYDPLSPPPPRRGAGRRAPSSRPNRRTRWGPVPAVQARLLAGIPPEVFARAHAILSDEAGLAYAAAHGLPTRFGSYAIVVAGRRMVGGAPALVGGPQMGFGTPQIAHEIHLTCPEFDVIGMGFAGLPGVLIGHNRHLAWTTTTGVGDVQDVFVETLHPENAGQYRYLGEWRSFERREEVIRVRGQDPVRIEVLRSVHGPVIQVDEGSRRAFAAKSSYWNGEHHAIEAILRFNRAKSLREFAAAVPLIRTSHNWFCATQQGEIGYWFGGWFPLRAPGIDPRFPTPGTGEKEWRGFRRFDCCPQAIDPKSGVIANWNNKPAIWWDHGDAPAWGAIHRVSTIQQRLARPGLLTVSDLRAIVREIGIQDQRLPLLPPLLRAAEGAKLSSAATLAIAHLRAWDGLATDGSVAKRIFDQYLEELMTTIFADELGPLLDRRLRSQPIWPTLMLRAIQGKQAAVPLRRDYLNGKPARTVMLAALEKACATLRERYGPEVGHWRYTQEWIEALRPLPPIPRTDRGTYILIVELCRPEVIGESILPPGQSEDPRSPHYGDQRELAGYWRFKPMWFDPRGFGAEAR